MHASGTDMHDAPQLSMSLAGLEQGVHAFYVGLVIKFCRDAGMIEAPREVVDSGCAIDCLLDLHSIGDISRNDRYCVTELLACFFFVTCVNTHLLLAFYNFFYHDPAQ